MEQGNVPITQRNKLSPITPVLTDVLSLVPPDIPYTSGVQWELLARMLIL